MHLEFQYKLRSTTIRGIAAFSAVAAAVFAAVGYSNDRPLMLNHMFLARETATAFYWVVAGGFGLTVLVLVYRVMLTQRIVLTDRGIRVPKSGWSTRETEIPYPAIAGVREIGEMLPLLVIVYRGGVARIYPSRLATPAEYETLRDALTRRLAAAQEAEEK